MVKWLKGSVSVGNKGVAGGAKVVTLNKQTAQRIKKYR